MCVELAGTETQRKNKQATNRVSAPSSTRKKTFMFSNRDDRQENLNESNLDKSKFYSASKSL